MCFFSPLARSSVKWNVYEYHKPFDIYCLTDNRLTETGRLRNLIITCAHIYARLNAVNSSMWTHPVLSLLSGTCEFTNLPLFCQTGQILNQTVVHFIFLCEHFFFSRGRFSFEWHAKMFFREKWLKEILFVLLRFQYLTSPHHERTRRWAGRSERVRQRDGRRAILAVTAFSILHQWHLSRSAFFRDFKASISRVTVLLCESWIFISVFLMSCENKDVWISVNTHTLSKENKHFGEKINYRGTMLKCWQCYIGLSSYLIT